LIRPLPPDELVEFRRLAEAAGYPYARPSWMDNVPCTPFGIYNAEDRLSGGFLLWERSYLGLRVIRTPLFCASIGPFLAVEPAATAAKAAEQQRKTIMELVDFLRKSRSALTWLALDSTHQDVLPFLWNGFKASPGRTFVLDLHQSEEELLAGMSGQRRQQLRKAAKSGVETQAGRDLDATEALVRVTFQRQGEPLPYPVLERLFSGLAKEDQWFTVVARVDGQLASAALFVQAGERVYHLFGGYQPELRSTQAGSATLWHGIRHAKALGARIFDFEGSMLPAVERFYSDFGGHHINPFRIMRGNYFLECFLKVSRRNEF